jgi:hypothetical protein
MRHLFLCIAVSVLGCGLTPNEKTGQDGFRHEATTLPLDEWVADENGVDYKGGDRTDWKRISLDKPVELYVQLSVDNNAAAVGVAVYNRYGKLLKEAIKARGSTKVLTFKVAAPKGNTFVQIYARTSDDKSVYSVRVSESPGDGNTIPLPE